MSTIQRIGVADFEKLLAAWKPQRKVTGIHVHQTTRPGVVDFRGARTLEAMRRYHVQNVGLSDIAQHLTIDPAGGLWTGRPFDLPPASIAGQNVDPPAAGKNDATAAGPFMIEVVGDFRNESFEDPQKTALHAVLSALMKRFELDPSIVQFHSCVGKNLKDGISAVLAAGSPPQLPPQSDAVLEADAIRNWRDAAARQMPVDHREPGHAAVPESEWMLDQQEFLADTLGDGDASRDLEIGPDDPLLAHVVNLSKGVLSSKGIVGTTRGGPTRFSSLRMIVDKHLRDYIEARKSAKQTPHLVFYAHGGLVDEESALCYARTILPWWLAHGVFPIFFIWESGLFETLRVSPREMGKRGISELWDNLLEGLTQPLARRVWAAMKQDAENASSRLVEDFQLPGGAFQFAEALRQLLIDNKGSLKLHAIGHSTGPIFLSKFMPLVTGAGVTFDTLSYLAPAIRIDRFKERVLHALLPKGKKRKVDDLTIYTMTDPAERDDDVAHIYRKSLLYFVREACDDIDEGRILGLEKDLFADAELKARFNLIPPGGVSYAGTGGCAIEFSPPRDAGVQNARTKALKHGDFDNDVATMTSVLARILGPQHPPSFDEARKQFPSKDAFKRCSLDSQRSAAEAGFRPVGDRCPCCGRQAGRDRFGDDDAQEDDPAGTAGSEPSRPPSPGGPSRGRRVALCVGIDQYRDQPLAGCVNDSRRWGERLRALGFQVRSLVDAEATRANIVQGLREMIASARHGDELVFQFAGHGTQVDDLTGDERDRFDEAFVPVDYDRGNLLIDDDFYLESLQLRDGVVLTLFTDCCHSGTNSRFAPRSRLRPGEGRVRFMPLSAEIADRFKQVRRGMALAPRPSERLAPKGVVHFAACRDDEYAYENNGQGDFTRHATELLDRAVREAWPNEKFMQEVTRKFGSSPRQHPLMLKPAGGLTSRPLLASVP
jgi:hypothetical protein